jgi:hypothetical protein
MSASMCESPCRSWPRTPHAAAGTARPAAGSPGKRHTPRRPAPPPAGRGRSRSRSPPPRPRRPRPSTGRSARAAEPSRPPPRAAASSPAPYTARPSPPRRDGPPPSHPRRTAAPALPSTMSNHVVSLRENHQRPNEAVLTPGGGHDIPAAINSPGYPAGARSVGSAASPGDNSAHLPAATRYRVCRMADPLRIIRR